MNNKILVKLMVPEIDENYDIFIPINVRIGTIINLINSSLSDVSNGLYSEKTGRSLYNIADASKYPVNALVRETNIRNGSIIVFM